MADDISVMDQIEAMAEWAEKMGEPFEDVPWQVVFLWDRPLTLEESMRPLFWREEA